MPDLDQLLNLDVSPLRITKTEDPGVSVVELDSSGPAPAARTERTWTLELGEAAPGAAAGSMFRFGRPRTEGAELIHQRYEDADLRPVAAEIPLSGAARGSRAGWILGGFSLLALAGVAAFMKRGRGETGPPPPAYAVPERPDPVTVLRLLARIRDEGLLKPELRGPIEASMRELELAYFGPGEAEAKPGLRETAERWVREAGPAPANGASRT